ncbi:MAG: BrnT family toxin [Chloroflexota bacterium]
MFEWDDDNEDHIARHGVETWEAEDAMSDRHQARIPAHSGRRGILGRTQDGRLLAVFFERRGSWVRVVTARDATATETRSYRRANR